MLGHGYSSSDYDNYEYHNKLLHGSFVYLLLYIDYMLIASKSISEINKLKS